MRMLIAALVFTSFTAAFAQPKPPPMVQGEPETVHSDALYDKQDPTARHFVEGYLEPEGGSADFQYSRWKAAICPHVIGLQPVAARFIEKRIRDVAAKVGAKIDARTPCRANIAIIFSDTPQVWLDTIASERQELVWEGSLRLTMKYPIQSWYAELVRGGDGALVYDELHTGQGCHQITRLNTDCTMEFGFATTIVDNRAMAHVPLASVADYAALVTLSQTRQNGQCHGVPTIANLTVPDCPAENHVTALSELDLGMLSGLYHSRDDHLQVLQKSLILRSMKDALRADTAPPASRSPTSQSKE